MLGEDDDSASILDLSLHRRGRGGCHEKRRERTQEPRGGDVELRLEFIEVHIATLSCREVHEVPCKKRVGQRYVGVNARGRERIAVKVNTFFEVAAFGDAPIAGDGMMTDVGEEEEIAVPIMEALAEVDARAMQGVEEGGFHEARFVDRPARTVIRARRPLDHPVKDFELAELRLPRREALSAQVIHEGMLAGSRAYSKERTQAFIKQVPFLLEAVESAGGFFLDGLFEGEHVFIGEFLGGHKFLTTDEQR